MFTANDIKNRLVEQPFVPLRIITSSGQSYDVPHPDLVWVSNRWLMIGKPSNENPIVVDADATSRVAILHITDVQDLPRPATACSDGK
jgi:hypothetical protein